jgi:hypothetical protein
MWRGLDAGFSFVAEREVEACSEAYGTWFAGFGVRGLACAATAFRAPAAVVAAAGVPPFVRGPHLASDEGFVLDLDAPRAFGHYDPAFVRWLVAHGVPEANALTQPVYDRRLQRLARVYWLTYADMAVEGFPRSTPAGALSDYAVFLEGGAAPDGAEGYDASGNPNGGFSVFAFTARSERLLPRVGAPPAVNEWEVKYEANTAYGFWLRRRADGTLPIWRDGLERLLSAYDAEWFSATL